ncbi:MAG: citrate (Si)-synthase [Desulfobacterales bacterium]|nr:citrate (Si)-synthase [Desulfobacteraceae bacterium]MBT4364498.1 citrate (Si)-synthase [Desulfobacteraceae bacterium]MBT7085531.1 citrate (Si)-synthase [Desulfobacterales bacterium]MBT7697617.1 citrate (Si)-synthase [Desulfobacterales bacterium]
MPLLNTGLRGFTVATTKISDVNGAEGKLIYRGFQAKDLAGKVSFEEVSFLLLYERLPVKSELKDFTAKLAENRKLPPQVIESMKNRPKDALPMDVLMSTISMLADYDPDINDNSHESVIEKGISLISKTATIVATWDRIRNGREPVNPDPEIGHAANFIYMYSGEKPDEELTSFFDTALTLHAEHSFNASTFSARQVASTKAHIFAAVSAGVGSLSGALHGGANTRVMLMLLKIGSADAIDDYINNTLDSGGVIMGLGHAVYQVDDPRALILAPMSKIMGERTGDTRWYDLSKELEKKAKEAFKLKKGIDIFVNVDFYSASLYYYMGIPVDLFTPVFAVSRMAGWVAHVLEEQFAGAAPKPVLYRPESEYIGEYCGKDECVFEEIGERTVTD